MTGPGGAPSRGAIVREFLGEALFYAAGTSLTHLVGFLLVPLYTRFLEREEFGRLALCESAIVTLGGLALFGLNVSVMRECARGSDLEHHRVALGTGLAFCLVVDGAVALGGGLLVRAWAPEPWSSLALPVMAVVLSETLVSLFTSYLRGMRRPRALVALSSIQALLSASLAVYLVVAARQGLQGILTARLVGATIAILIAVPALREVVAWRLDRALLGRMLSFGLPTVLTATATMLLLASGRYWLLALRDLEEVALYAGASKLTTLFGILLVQPIGVAWGGALFHIEKRPDARATLARLGGAVMLLSCPGVLWFDAFAPELIQVLLGPAYADTLPLVLPMLLIQQLLLFLYPATAGLYLTQRTGTIAAWHAMGAACGLALGGLLIASCGKQGAAWATALSLALVVCGCHASSRRVYDVPYDLVQMLLALSVVAASSSLAWIAPRPVVALVATALLVALARGRAPRSELDEPEAVD